MEGFKTYNELEPINEAFKKNLQAPLTFGKAKNTKAILLKYKKDYDGTTQHKKPVLLLEDLIKTFSNENDFSS